MDKLPSFFLRRYDSHKIEKVMRKAAIHSYWDTRNKEDFKVELAKTSVDTFLYSKYGIDLSNLSEEDWGSIINYIIKVFNPLMDMYYKNLKRDYPLSK